MAIPEYWECESCRAAQTHQTHLAQRWAWQTVSEYSTRQNGGWIMQRFWLCDDCYKAVGGTCDEPAR